MSSLTFIGLNESHSLSVHDLNMPSPTTVKKTAGNLTKSAIDFEVGIDTGGTFTDAAVLALDDLGNVKVLQTAKALTTKGNLAIGVGEALKAVLTALRAPGTDGHNPDSHNPDSHNPDSHDTESQPYWPRPHSISVSTTLATNAVVEGDGDRVGIVLIGFDDQMAERIGVRTAFPDCPVFRTSGGHTHSGKEAAPFDSHELTAFATAQASSVQAFAVASMFAVRNPAHEQRAADAISIATGLPVTISSELTGALDAPRRALTAILNARLVGKISALILAVEKACAELDLHCPIYFVKGDGTRASAESVRLRPIETVMSGPAASTIGAAALSGLSDCIMSDVGGTTTDVAVLTNGQPAISDDGATVGGWRTLVRAADIRTHGLGGDSRVRLRGNAVSLGPDRVVPVSLLALRYPQVLSSLQADLADSTTANTDQCVFVLLPFGRSAERPSDVDRPADSEQEVLDLLNSGPRPLRYVATNARRLRVVETLRQRGLLAVSAPTVSDAAHVAGLQTMWSTLGAQLCFALLSRVRLMRDPSEQSVLDLALSVLDAAYTRSALAVLEVALPAGLGGSTLNQLAEMPLLRDVAAGQPNVGMLHVTIAPQLPIVAVGGPAPLLYPTVGSRLGTRVVLLEHGAVANAVGAAIGPVRVSIEIVIEHTENQFRILGPTGASAFGDLTEALKTAVAMAREYVEKTAISRGARYPTVTHSATLTYLPGRTDDTGLLSATVSASATGRPSTA